MLSKETFKQQLIVTIFQNIYNSYIFCNSGRTTSQKHTLTVLITRLSSQDTFPGLVSRNWALAD